MSETFNLVVVSAGTSDPSSTRLLADRTAQRVAALAEQRGAAARTRVIDLRELATDITTALTSQLVTPKLQQAVDVLGAADGIIAAAPVYKAGPSGLFTSFFHVLDNDLLIGKPAVLAATAGTARHALVVDDQMRPLFAYLRTLPVPTSLFAAPEDWGAGGGEPRGGEPRVGEHSVGEHSVGEHSALNKRIDRAAFELVLLMESGFARAVRDEAWQSYQHEFGSAGGTELGIDTDSDLMRLATGGSAA
jgi:FMN reductase